MSEIEIKKVAEKTLKTADNLGIVTEKAKGITLKAKEKVSESVSDNSESSNNLLKKFEQEEKLKKIKEKLITLIDIHPKHLMIQLRPTILYRKTRQRILKTKSAVQAVSKQKKPYLPLNQNNLS